MTEFEQAALAALQQIAAHLANIEARLPACADAETAPPRDPASVRVGERVECRRHTSAHHQVTVMSAWRQQDIVSQQITAMISSAFSSQEFSYDADLSQPGTWRFLPADAKAGEQ